MKKTIFAILAIAFCTIWTACEKTDYEVVPPTFKGFKYSPTTIHPGDSVRFTACYRNEGKNIYLVGHKGYKWTLSLDTLDANGDPSKTGRWSRQYTPYCSISDGEPTIKLEVPKTAMPGTTAQLNFVAEYSNAADGAPGTSLPNQTEEGYVGTFQPSTVTSVLYSRASGSMTFKIY